MELQPNNRSINCVVSCRDRSGVPTLVPVKVYWDGDTDSDTHYDEAANVARDRGYRNVGMIYDENDGPTFLFEQWDFSVMNAEGDEPEADDEERDFRVTQYETHTVDYIVQARSEVEAVFKVLHGDGERGDPSDNDIDEMRGIDASDLPLGFASELTELARTRNSHRSYFDDGRLTSIAGVEAA